MPGGKDSNHVNPEELCPKWATWGSY